MTPPSAPEPGRPGLAAPRALVIERLGLMPYAAAWERQESLREARLAGTAPDTILLLQHPDVITFGRGADAANAPDEATLRAAGYEVFRVNRGGDVTYHGPGQLVGYPVLDLGAHGRDVHAYLRRLEGVLIDALADLGISAVRRDGYTGVWIDERRKIASIGVGLRRWVTLHGFALNVTGDLSRFDAIVACGLPDVEMTSVAELAGEVAFVEVEDRVAAHLQKAFG